MRLLCASGGMCAPCSASVPRFEYSADLIEQSDIVFTMGGDGTFLLGATRILHPNKPIVGINSDPTRSEGHLLLPKQYSANIREAVKKLLAVSRGGGGVRSEGSRGARSA